MLDKATVMKIAHHYANEVRKTLNPQSVILFGSYASGTPHEYSDTDIAVVFNGFQGDWLETSTYLVGLAWNEDGYIEPHLLDTANDSSGFLEQVRKTGEIIYSV